MGAWGGFQRFGLAFARMSANAFLSLRGTSSRLEIVSHNLSALHYELYSLHLSDILERIS